MVVQALVFMGLWVSIQIGHTMSTLTRWSGTKTAVVVPVVLAVALTGAVVLFWALKTRS